MSEEPDRSDPQPDGDTAPADPAEEVFYCDLCGTEMINRHCKLVCPACGYQRDCSDP